MDQMEKITVAIVKEKQPVALIIQRLALELDAFGFQLFVRGVEIIDGDGEVSDAGILVGRHGLRWQGAFAGNDFKNAAVGSFYEIVAGVAEIDVEAQMVDVPLS